MLDDVRKTKQILEQLKDLGKGLAQTSRLLRRWTGRAESTCVKQIRVRIVHRFVVTILSLQALYFSLFLNKPFLK